MGSSVGLGPYSEWSSEAVFWDPERQRWLWDCLNCQTHLESDDRDELELDIDDHLSREK